MKEQDINKQYEKLLAMGDAVSNNTQEDGKLTDENVNSILDAMKDSEDKDLLNILAMPDVELDPDEFETKEVMVSYNPATGEKNPVDDDMVDYEHKDAKNLLDVLEDDDLSSLGSKYIIDEIVLTEELSGKFNLETEEAIKFARVVNRVKSGEKFNIYRELPNSIKFTIDKECLENEAIGNQTRNMMAKFIVDEFIRDYEIDQDLIDLEESLQEAIAEKDAGMKQLSDEITETYVDMLISRMDAFYDLADKAREESPEKAKLLTDMGDACKDSINLEGLKAAIEKGIKIKPIDKTQPERIFKDFNFKYVNHKMNINDVTAVPSVLDRHLDKEKYSHEDILRFTLCFCKYCRLMTPDNLVDHTFMYYFVKNIVSLDFLVTAAKEPEEGDVNKSYDLYNSIISNISECINLIKGKIQEKKEPSFNPIIGGTLKIVNPKNPSTIK